MIARPIAVPPPEVRPHPRPPPDPADPPISFTALLTTTDAPSLLGHGRASSKPPAEDDHPRHKDDKQDDADATAEAYVAAPTPPAQPKVPKGTESDSGRTAAAAPDGAKPQRSADTASIAGTGTAAGKAGAEGAAKPAPLPPGAAELDARVAAGAPALVSQPTAALATVPHELTKPTHASGKPDAAGPLGAPAIGNGTAPATQAQPQPPGPAPASQTAGNGAAPAAAPTAAQGLPIEAAADAGGPSTKTADADPTAGSPVPTTPLSLQAPSTMPTPPADAAVRPPVLLPQTAEQVAISLKQAVNNGVEQIEIQLKPASLGAIDVKLNVAHDGRVMAVISADRSDTLNLLQGDASGLAQALRDAGLQADSGSLSFNLRGDPNAFSQGGSPGQGNAGRNIVGTYYDDAPLTDLPAAAIRRHAGSLDIHV